MSESSFAIAATIMPSSLTTDIEVVLLPLLNTTALFVSLVSVKTSKTSGSPTGAPKQVASFDC